MTRHIILCLVLSLCVGCGGAPKSGKIVFQSNRDGNFEIYTMKDDGSDVHRLTNSPSYDITPSWSPDGKRILFASDREGNWEIYTMDAAGGDVQRLLGPPGAHTAPSWADKGAKILFLSTREFLNGQIYMMDNDGKNLQRITSDSSVKESPVQSPDGLSILYSIAGQGGSGVMSLRLQDRTITRLTPEVYNASNAHYSDDGSAIVLDATVNGRSGIYTMPASGGTLVLRTRPEDDSRTPCWANGTHGFLYSRNDGLSICIMDSSIDRQISSRGDRHPHWIAN
jgi:Tol biopolymer transport system component